MNQGFDFSYLNLNYKPIRIASVASTINFPIRRIVSASMVDDFYSNLIDWYLDKIFYCADDTIYMYNFHTESTTTINKFEPGLVSSVKCLKQLNILAVGAIDGTVTFFDLITLKSTKCLYHRGRISCFDVFENNIITGSRDKRSKIIDGRTKMPVISLSFHSQEVCGISINTEHKYIASGGNDNKVFVADLRKPDEALIRIEEHKAAVKALSWSPICTSKFASGGGTADKSIKIWDIHLNERLSNITQNLTSLNLKSSIQSEDILIRNSYYEGQVCNLKWLNNNKIIASFGYSNNDIKLLNDLNVERKYTGHKNRVIHFAVEDTQKFFVSGSGDSSIKIWEIEGKAVDNDVKIR